MARPLRLEYPGALYHITARGNARQDIYLDDSDRAGFLELLGSIIQRFHWLCHAYCLMDNHYHLLIETPYTNLSTGMRQLNGVYTQRFNRRHGRVGHVFQGRFKAILVDRDSYLLELARYIVLNPVRAKMRKHAGDYVWSSYSAMVGEVPAPALLTTESILVQFGRQKVRSRARYAAFVREGLGAESIWNNLQGQVILGSEKFVTQMEPLLKKAVAIKEVPKVQRYVSRPSLKEVFRSTADKAQRNKAIRQSYLDYGYSMADVARYLGLHYSTVSGIVNLDV